MKIPEIIDIREYRQQTRTKMSKYIIKMKDGSEQHVMPAVHNTLKEALLTLSHYLTGVAEDMDDDSMEDPFNYAIEEVDKKEKLSESDVPFDGVARLVEDINPKRIEAQLALNKLVSMAEAWNKEDGFVPDFSNPKQIKWFPWLRYDQDAAVFVYVGTFSITALARAHLSPRVCFKSSARAKQFFEQFIDLYNKVFL